MTKPRSKTETGKTNMFIRFIKSENLRTYIGTAAALVTIIMAIVTITSNKKSREENLKILNSLSTRHIGKFASDNQINAIIELINNAKSNLVIVTDFPAYASFSKPEKYRIYEKAIINKVSNKEFKALLICYNKENRKEMFAEQFNIPPKLFKSNISTDVIPKKKINKYCKSSGINPDSLKTYEDLSLHLDSIDDAFLKFLTHRKNVTVLEVDRDEHPLQIFYWLTDLKSSVFSFHTIGSLNKQLTETSFCSRDKEVIDFLKNSLLSLRINNTPIWFLEESN